MELPIAHLTWWYAECHRDKEQRSEPFQPEDFYHFPPLSDEEDDGRPPAEAGAAAQALLTAGAMPFWAYPFAEALLDAAGDDTPVPERVALLADDAILLAPRPGPGGRWIGFLIAEDSAIGQVRWFSLHSDEEDQDADQIQLIVPPARSAGAVQAEAGACLSPP